MIVNRDVIRDWRGKILGFIETDDKGNKVVKDFYRKILGRYDKRTNLTKDFYGRIIAKGDQCSLLIGTNNK